MRIFHLCNCGHCHSLHVWITVVALWVWGRSSRRPETPWQYPEGAGDTISPDEYTLILRQVLMSKESSQSCLNSSIVSNSVQRTSPSGPWRNTAPRAFQSENWMEVLGSGLPTLTPNDTCESFWVPKKAMFAQDIARSQPVTKTMSSISIPSPSLWAKMNQLSICFTIHNLKSPSARVSSRRAVTGKDNTAAPRVLLYVYVTCLMSRSSGLALG